MKVLMIALVVGLAAAPGLRAQDANGVRGGWVADIGGHRHIYMLIVRGDVVTGTYCADCADPRNLSFVQGKLTTQGASFLIRHQGSDDRLTVDDVRGVLHDGQLTLTVRRGHGTATTVNLHRPAASPNVNAVTNDEAETRGITGRTRPAYVLPGPATPITAQDLIGV